MTLRFVQWAMDVRDIRVMAAFWSRALGYEVSFGDDGDAKLSPPGDASADQPTVWLQTTPEDKQAKNRNHPDFRPEDGDVEGAVQRLVALGAGHVDVGQTDDSPFVVLADPEGNEFCVLREPTRPGGP